MRAVMVRYADDFVVLCRKGQGTEMHRRLKCWLEKRGLKLNEEKTRVVDFEKENIEFLGFRLAWRKARSGKHYPLMKQTEERHSESRMRQICKSGSMRGMEVGGHWPWASHSATSVPTLPDPLCLSPDHSGSASVVRAFWRPKPYAIFST